MFHGSTRMAFEQAGYKDPRQTGATSSAPNYGPTTGIKEDISSALMQRNGESFNRNYQKLVQFYAGKGLENAEEVARRDFQSMNPIVRAMAGKKPTQEQYERVYSGLTPAQRQSVNASVSAWDWGAGMLGLNYNAVSEPRGGGLSGGSAGAPERRITPGRSGIRPVSLSSGRRPRKIRISRVLSATSRRRRSLRPRKLRLSRARGGYRRPRQRRLRLV